MELKFQLFFASFFVLNLKVHMCMFLSLEVNASPTAAVRPPAPQQNLLSEALEVLADTGLDDAPDDADDNDYTHGVTEDTAEKIYQCPACPKTFKSTSGLKRHHVQHLPEEERRKVDTKLFQCDVCNKVFKDQSNFNWHRKIHTNDRKYKCDICQRSFIRKSHLRKHEVVHTGEKPYSCDQCGKSFSHHASLFIHQKIHQGITYECPTCQKSFNRLPNMLRHQRTHTGEKPYKCEVCEKRFSNHTGLKQHVRIHTGEKPYGCIQCGHRFSQIGHLNKHVKKCNGEASQAGARQAKQSGGAEGAGGKEKPYVCGYCMKKFLKIASLEKHFIMKHGLKSEQKKTAKDDGDKSDSAGDAVKANMELAAAVTPEPSGGLVSLGTVAAEELASMTEAGMSAESYIPVSSGETMTIPSKHIQTIEIAGRRIEVHQAAIPAGDIPVQETQVLVAGSDGDDQQYVATQVVQSEDGTVLATLEVPQEAPPTPHTAQQVLEELSSGVTVLETPGNQNL